MAKQMKEFFKITDIIREKEKRKKCLLYGLDYDTKRLLLSLVNECVYIDGFLLDKQEDALHDIKLLNKKMYSINDLYGHEDDYLIIDVFGHNIEFLKNDLHCYAMNYFEPRNRSPVIIYGAGNRGKKAYDLLHSVGIDVLAFCDRSTKKQGKMYCGHPVLSPEKVKDEYRGYTLVIALENGIAPQVAEQMPEMNSYLYESDLLMSRILIGQTEAGTRLELEPIYLYYHIQHMSFEKLYFWGSIDDCLQLRNKLACLDIPIDRAVSTDGFTGKREDIVFVDPYDFLYQDTSEIAIWALPEAEEKVRQFREETGLDDICYIKSTGVFQLDHETVLDPNLGYNIRYHGEDSVIRLQSGGRKGKRKIGILGGSTSDVTALIETSWPEALRDIATAHDLDWEIYAGGTVGYLVSQELVKFVRDMVHLRLDTLISYSRVNEWILASTRSLFIHRYQQDIFRKIAAGKKNASRYDDIDDMICYGYQEKDVAEHWLRCERMMYAICKEFNIRFYAILQPVLFEKSFFTEEENEIMEHLHADIRSSEYIDCLRRIRDRARDCMSGFPWLVDFSEIFDSDFPKPVYIDHCQLTSYGNEMIARNIFPLIHSEGEE